MSESAAVVAVLCISGGFQDAYTFNCRDGVFANAQTGNMVLMGQNFAMGNWQLGVRYLLPVLAFAVGIYAAEKIRRGFGQSRRIHWRQVVALSEAFLLFGVGFLPQETNMLANMLVSFVCAMQVQSFRKLNGNSYATTMCIGNLRTATELWCSYRSTGDRGLRQKKPFVLWVYRNFHCRRGVRGSPGRYLQGAGNLDFQPAAFCSISYDVPGKRFGREPPVMAALPVSCTGNAGRLALRQLAAGYLTFWHTYF